MANGKMEKSYKRLKENKTLKTLFLGLFLIILVGILYIFRYYLWPFLFALILYVALRPLHDKILKFVKKRNISATLMILLLFLLILVPMFALLISLADQTYQFYLFIGAKVEAGLINDIQNLAVVKKAIAYFQIEGSDAIKKLTEVVQKTAGTAFSSITSIISFPISFITNFFFMILMLFFMLKDGNRMDEAIYKALPFPDDIEKKVFDRLKEVIKVLLAGNLMIMILQGIMLGLGLYIAGFSMPLLWGSIAAILSLIPVIGTLLIWLPAVIYLIITGSYFMALFVGIWSLFWYMILENLIKPKVFGDKLHFHPIVFFFLLLGSIQAFSLPGVIIGPILLTLFYSFWEIYKFFDLYDMDNLDG